MILIIYLFSMPLAFLVAYLNMRQMRKAFGETSITYSDLMLCCIISLGGPYGVIGGLIALLITHTDLDKPLFKNKNK